MQHHLYPTAASELHFLGAARTPVRGKQEGGIEGDVTCMQTYPVLLRNSSCVTIFALVLLSCGIARADSLNWVPQGSAPNTQGQVESIRDREVAGAIRAVAPHPTDPNVIFVGVVNGGVWRTTNATAGSPTWQQLTDGADSQSIGALQFDPTDATHQTLVAGIGRFSSFRAGGALVGLMRSIDGGTTWTTFDGSGILKGANISGVAPRGNITVVSADTGVFRGTKANTGWVKISGAPHTELPAGRSFELASDPQNPSRLFTAGTYGIYRSDDVGATWKKISNSSIDKLLNGNTENIKLVVGVQNGVYVAIANSGHLTGLFRSGDAGNTWGSLDLPRTIENGKASFDLHPGGQADIHLSLVADRNNANTVYVGGDRQPHFDEGISTQAHWPNSIGARDYSGRLFRVDASLPPGKQCSPLTHSDTASNSAPHADSRNMAIAANGDILEVDDGGIYRRTNPLTKGGDWFSMNRNLQVTEFHSIAWDANAHIILGGAQDTGSPEQIAMSDVRWRSISTGDGGAVAVDDSSTAGLSVRYSSYQYLDQFRRRVYDSANTFQSETFPGLRVLGSGAPLQPKFYTPIELNSIDPRRIAIAAANSVYESTDQGDTIREIGPNIQVNDSGPIAYGAKDNPNVLYVGAGSAIFVRTGASSAPLSRSTAFPGNIEVVGIAIDPGNSKAAFVADQTDIFRTTNSGGQWSKVTGNLQRLNPVVLRTLVFADGANGGRLFVGTNNGVYESSGPSFSAWSRIGSGLPNVPVYRLTYSRKDKVLLAGTLGRGAWTLDLTKRP